MVWCGAERSGCTGTCMYTCIYVVCGACMRRLRERTSAHASTRMRTRMLRAGRGMWVCLRWQARVFNLFNLFPLVSHLCVQVACACACVRCQ